MFKLGKKKPDDWQDRVKSHKQKLRDASIVEREAVAEAAKPRERKPAEPRGGFGKRGA